MQQTLFHEDVFEALRTDIMACGGMKAVGLTLFPEKGAKAGDYLSTCLNSTRPEKLDIEQVMVIKRLARQKGSFATHRYEEEDLGVTHATPIEPEDKRAILQREFVQSVERLEQIRQQLGRVES